MSLLISRLIGAYNYMNNDLADPRVKEWFLLESPIPTLLILASYHYFVFDLGPKFMKNRPAFKLDKVLIIYNILQIIACLYLVIQALRLTAFKYSYVCEPVNYTNDPEALEIARCTWLYFIIKVVDLLDTVFFVLRKKTNQISFLHVYHHTGMVLLGWGGTKYLAGGHSVFVGFLNCIVHCVMYFYYLLTAWNSEYKKSVWWKKHITQMQMVQFLMLIYHFGQLLFQPNCRYPKWTVWMFVPQNVFMIVLFADFYRKAYMKKPKREIPSYILDENSSLLAQQAVKDILAEQERERENKNKSE